MKTYTATSGQSIYDVCLNTYMSLNFLVKLMQDNNFPNINTYPYSGQQFTFDETLIQDQNVTNSNNLSGTVYSTSNQGGRTILSTIQIIGSSSGAGGNGTTIPAPPQPPDQNAVKYYEQTLQTEFHSNADGTKAISLAELINATRIVQMFIELTPVKDIQYSFNANSGQITLSGTAVDSGMTLYIIYVKTITS